MKILMLGLAGMLAAHASVLEVPYSSGKQYGTVDVPYQPDVNSSSGSQLPDTIRIGALNLRFSLQSLVLPAVCGAKPTVVLQFLPPFGRAWQAIDTSTDWNAFTTYPAADGLVALDSIDGWNSQTQVKLRAPGFPFLQSGPDNRCTGNEYFMERRWNRVVFLTFGSGVGYRAKISFQSLRDTAFGVLPSFRIVRSMRLFWVINPSSTDMSGPVSLKPDSHRNGNKTSRFGVGVPFEVYNPLGVRLTSDRGRFEAALPSSRSARPLHREAK